MHGARFGRRMPHAHKRLSTSMGKERDRAVHMIADDAQVVSVLVHRPRRDFGEPVAGSEPHGIHDARVVRDLGRGVVPPVKAVPNVATVTKRDPLLQQRGLRAE